MAKKMLSPLVTISDSDILAMQDAVLPLLYHNPHGAAATNMILFNLGVDMTLNYTGVVHLKIGYCDGDTCELDYPWNPPVNNGGGSISSSVVTGNPRIFSVNIKPIDSTVSFSISLKDTTAKIIAVTAASPSPDLDSGNLFDMNATMHGNDVLYSRKLHAIILEMDYFESIVFAPGVVSSSDTIPIVIRYFDKNGREIGRAKQDVIVSKIISKVNPAGIAPDMNEDFINSVVPNPGSGTMTFTYTLGVSEDARVELFNLLGQSVAVISDGFLSQGVHESSFNASALSEGTYYLRLTTPIGNASTVVKVIH